MRLGVSFAQREIPSDAGAIREYAQAAESLGYEYMSTGDHVLGAGISNRPDWSGPYTHKDLWHEPLTLFGFLAGVTRTLGFLAGVLILPQRQASLVAKQAAVVDVLSNGRLRLGVGVGWNDVEYEALDEEFGNRGERIEEQIEVMRALWTQELVTFEGRWHRITDAGINPLPVQRPIPIWFGGGPGSAGSRSARLSDRVLRRIARMGNGWLPTLDPDENGRATIARLHEHMREAGRDPADMGLQGSVPIADQAPEEWVQRALAWRELGATHLAVGTASAGFSTVSEHLDALGRAKEALGPALK